MHIPSAEDSRRAADAVVNSRVEGQLKRAADAIRGAARVGHYDVNVEEANPSGEVFVILQAQGYVVTNVSLGPNESGYNISWRKPPTEQP